MFYYTETDPFFEAWVYLTQRFIKDRTSARIAQLEPPEGMMVDIDWARFEDIADIEHELDKAFPADELMEQYFMPLETKERVPKGFSVSIGGILLGRPQALKVELSFDALLDFYRSASLPEVLSHFYDHLRTTFFTEPGEICESMTSFMTFIDDVLVNPQDKWSLMDAAANPVRHLESLRELLESMTAYIERREREFLELIKTEKEDFLKGSILDAINSIGFSFCEEDLERIIIRPSLLAFNNVSYASSRDGLGEIHIYLGIFGSRLIKLRTSGENIKTYMNMLKLLSDSTRLSALHDMRNRYSYGQELAEKLKCTRNTMYYHLEKMLGLGLIKCRETEYRMLYTMNKKVVYEKLTALRDYLTDGWEPGKPEDEPELPK